MQETSPQTLFSYSVEQLFRGCAARVTRPIPHRLRHATELFDNTATSRVNENEQHSSSRQLLYYTRLKAFVSNKAPAVRINLQYSCKSEIKRKFL